MYLLKSNFPIKNDRYNTIHPIHYFLSILKKFFSDFRAQRDLLNLKTFLLILVILKKTLLF